MWLGCVCARLCSVRSDVCMSYLLLQNASIFVDFITRTDVLGLWASTTRWLIVLSDRDSGGKVAIPEIWIFHHSFARTCKPSFSSVQYQLGTNRTCCVRRQAGIGGVDVRTSFRRDQKQKRLVGFPTRIGSSSSGEISLTYVYIRCGLHLHDRHFVATRSMESGQTNTEECFHTFLFAQLRQICIHLYFWS